MIIQLNDKEREEFKQQIMNEVALSAIRKQITPVINEVVKKEVFPKIERRLKEINIDNIIRKSVNNQVEKIFHRNFCVKEFYSQSINQSILRPDEKERIRNMLGDKIIKKLPLYQIQKMALEEIKKKIIKME